MNEKLQSFFVFLFSISLLPYIGYIIAGKVDFLLNNLEYTDLHLSLIQTATIITYINVACLIGIAIYTLYWSKKRPVLLLSAVFFLLRIPWLLRLFSSFGISLQIVSDVFTFGFMLFLLLYAYLEHIPRKIKTLNGFTLLSGFFNCSVGISSGLYFTIYPVNFSDSVRRFFIYADIVSWGIFGALLVINMLLVHIHVAKIQNSVAMVERNVKYVEKLLSKVKFPALSNISANNSAIKSLIKSNDIGTKNSFDENTLETYYTDISTQFEYVEPEIEEIKKPVEIPKITRKDQIYWICEQCGLSNPYFLSKCKECNFERPDILYDKYTPVLISKNKIISQFSISEVITNNWQTLEAIAEKMGIDGKKGIEILRNKLEDLAKVNYVTSNSAETMYKLNNFEL